MPGSSELRQDPFTRNWVAVVPERGRRPGAFRRGDRGRLADGPCPFCPGHEAETPAEVWRLGGASGGWRVRVVPNKYATFAGDGPAPRSVSPAGFVAMPGVGRHEVIIESPRHSADLPDLAVDAVRDVLEAYRARYRALRADRPVLVIIFRNHGPGAGTSLAHPHSQIVALPVVPVEVRHRVDVAVRHFDDTGGNLYLDVLARELSDGRRIVRAGERFVAFQPFAAAAPFETWIVPRVDVPAFGDASDADLDELAPLLHAVLGGLRRALDDPDYNYVIASASPGDEDRGCFVWHLRVVPRLTTPAGFELGTGMRVNPSRPEETAATLRRAMAEAPDADAIGTPEDARSRAVDPAPGTPATGDDGRA